MMILNQEILKDAFKLQDGEEFIYEYIMAGVWYQEKAIKVGKNIYYKIDGSMYDKEWEKLDCYAFFDKENNMRIAVRTLKGSIELQ